MGFNSGFKGLIVPRHVWIDSIKSNSFVAFRREAAVSNGTQIVIVAARKSETFQLLPWVGFGNVLLPEYWDENLDTVYHFSNTELYMVIQKDGEIFWKVIVSVLWEKLHMNVSNSESLLSWSCLTFKNRASYI